jgi:hypothetical protein
MYIYICVCVCVCFRFVSELPSFYVYVSILLWLSFSYNIRTVHVNMAFQLMCMFAMKSGKKTNSALYSIFQSSLHSIFSYFSFHVVGICQTLYRYYCRSVTSAFQLPTNPSAERLSYQQNYTKIHQRGDVFTRKWRGAWEKKKALFAFSSPNSSSSHGSTTQIGP